MAKQTLTPGDKRYSDEAHDPFAQEADAIFNRPDMQALDDQGDSIIRDHEDDGDDGGDGDNLSDRASDRLDKQHEASADRRAAEKEEWDAAGKLIEDNPKNNPKNQQSDSGGGPFNKKNSLRVGITGGAIGIILMLFGLLTPFKLPAILQSITDIAGQRMEQITTHRAKVIVARYIYSYAGVPGDPVITGKGPVSSLIATMRTNKFEKKLEAKGLTFEKSGNGVKLKFSGKDMGVFKNPEAIQKALDADELTSRMMRDVVNEEMSSWRFFKKAKFAKWMRIRYHTVRSIPKSTETDKEKKIQELEETRIKEANARSTQNAMQMLDCVSNGARCPITDGKNGQETKLSSSDDAKAAVEKTLTETGEEVAEKAAKEAIETGTKTGLKLSTALATKAIPIVGWIDLAATINHFAVRALNAADDDLIVKIPAYFRSASYIQAYGDWAGYSDQVKAGDMDEDYHAVLANQLDGIEQSQAFACLDETDTDCTVGTPVKNRIDEDNPSAIKKALDKSQEILGFSAPAIYKYTPTNLTLEAWYYVSNKITSGIATVFFAQLKFQIGVINKIVGFITGVDVEKEMSEWFSEIISKFMNHMLSVMGLTIDPLDKGADLGNNLVGGGLAAFANFCEGLCRDLSAQQGYEQDASIAVEKAEDVASKGWMYAAFSPDATNSITNKLATIIPSSLSPNRFNLVAGTTQLASIVAGSPGQFLGSVVGDKAHADSTDRLLKLYGIKSRGATAADLSQPVASQAISGDECPEIAAGEYNNCAIDKAVAESMMCNFDSENPNCTFATPASANGNVNAMTYNILGSSHDNDGGQSWQARMGDAVATVRAEQPEIIGFQEVSGADEQRQKLRDGLADTYDGYPYISDKVGGGSFSPIYWNKSRYTALEKGVLEYPRYDNSDAKFPYVKLQYIGAGTPGAEFYVFNVHTSANGYSNANGLSPPEARKMQTERLVAKIKSTVPSGTPVVVTGDFNSTCSLSGGDSPLGADDLPCSIMKAAGFTDAGQAAKAAGTVENYEYSTSHGSAGATPKKQSDGEGRHIDHVFFSSPVTVSQWKNVITEQTKDASDHTPVVASLSIPGVGGSGDSPSGGGPGDVTASGFAWPLGASNWKNHRANHLASHYSGGGFLGSSYSNSVDISWGGTKGTQVYAMLGGTVTTQPLGRSGRQCHGTPDGNDNGGMIITSEINGHTVKIAYAHGDNIKARQGATVKAGDPIMDVGNVGNSCGAHLHMNVSVDNKNICPQDLFIAMDKGGTIDLAALSSKATATCGGRG